MFHLGVSDMVQAIGHLIGGIMAIVGSSGPYWMNEVIGAIMNSNWMSYGALLHLLAFNRFIHFCFVSSSNIVIK